MDDHDEVSSTTTNTTTTSIYADTEVTSHSITSSLATHDPLVFNNQHHRLLGGNTSNNNHNLPEGWTTAHRVTDNKIYYWEIATGRTSWSHPSELISSTNGDSFSPSNIHDINSSTIASVNRQEQHHQPNVILNYQPQIVTQMSTKSNNNYDTTTTKKSPLLDEQNFEINHQNSEISNAAPSSRNSLICAILSLILCPPLGLISAYHALMSRQLSNIDNHEELSRLHASKSYNYAWFGLTLSIVFWVYYGVIQNRGES